MSLDIEIYEAAKAVLERESYVARHTPRYDKDERVNILWLWAKENYDRLYDPSKGNLEQWLNGCRKRVVDVYRQDFKLQREDRGFVSKEIPFSVISDIDNLDNWLFDPVFDKQDAKEDAKVILKILEKEISLDSSLILINKIIDRIEDEYLADTLNCSKVSLHSRRTLTKNKIRKVLENGKARDCRR